MLTELMRETYTYQFADEPRYDVIIAGLKGLLKMYRSFPNRIFSWNMTFFTIFKDIIQDADYNMMQHALQNMNIMPQADRNDEENLQEAEICDRVGEQPINFIQ